MKLGRLAPLKGKPAVEFMIRFGGIIESEVNILPCGCMTITKNEPTPLIFYIHICPFHTILEKVNYECNKRIWRSALFKPYREEI